MTPPISTFLFLTKQGRFVPEDAGERRLGIRGRRRVLDAEDDAIGVAERLGDVGRVDRWSVEFVV